ncbi:MAG: hypothetical protein IPJ65_42785 [Archangiaceae bacterium]|nr:hypothetical protein [Archangiaceae bacterium]
MARDPDDAAMQAVLDDMGRAAKMFKAKKYAPKPPPEEAQPEAAPAEPADAGMPTADELSALLGNAG